MIILGLNAYHGDAAACCVRDGRIVAAAEEERFRRIKHWAGFPSEAIRYCLKEAGARLSDVDYIAINSDPKANMLRRLGYAAKRRPDLGLIIDRVRNQGKRASIESELARAFPGDVIRGKIRRVEHHLAHLASSYLVSPFRDVVAVSVDGFGDFASAAWGIGRNSTMSLDGRVWFPHSLGAFYQALTQYLGFPNYGDEYKVMGLAPYGEPRFLPEMRRIVLLQSDGTFALDLKYFRHHREKIAYEWSGGSPHVGTLFSPEMETLLGPPRKSDEPLTDRHRDIARSVQAMYEEAFFHLLGRLYDRYQLTDLALAGGCAMNSVANGKIRRLSSFKRTYIQSAAGDAGGAIGAAMHVWCELAGPDCNSSALTPSALSGDIDVGRPVMDHAYLGLGLDNQKIARLLECRADELAAKCCSTEDVTDELDLCHRTAQVVAEGKVVGWFQGRMEWGPRALGNRSIICDPRRADMKEILNLKIKRRESFRPFAPSIQREHVAEWFEEDDDVPFMMQVFQIRESKRCMIPAVTHVDGSGRLQTVYKQTNPRYWNLIDAFRALTGVPMVLNTSFNENEPVVCRPEEALDCFLRTDMDVLVLGDWVVRRQTN
ncbi:Decarbamoylnovobiocin carbamoyltransferase [Hyphomicrobium sp. ghe19]|nr:Decarbamoylnovobiocin carbamoyltransferase [Hyphomicrobium sp. ghe19]